LYDKVKTVTWFGVSVVSEIKGGDSAMDRGMNMKPGINYCAPVGRIGFRGTSDNLARLIPLPEKSHRSEEILFFHGVDVPAAQLPYLPDMGPGSAFEAKAFWHHYRIVGGIFIVHLTPEDDDASSFTMRRVLQAVLFEGEKSPRVFLDRRDELSSEEILDPEDLKTIQDLLGERQFVLN
jgi:hypothetical protein